MTRILIVEGTGAFSLDALKAMLPMDSTCELIDAEFGQYDSMRIVESDPALFEMPSKIIAMRAYRERGARPWLRQKKGRAKA